MNLQSYDPKGRIFNRPLRAGAALWAISVAIGAWAAYDTRAALLRAALLLLALAPVLLALAGKLATLGQRSWHNLQPSTRNLQSSIFNLQSLAAAIALAIAAYYLLSRVVTLPEDINANVAANAMAILLPLALAGAATRTKRSAIFNLQFSIFNLIVLVALFVSGSRGAWLGLAAGAVAALIVWAMDRRGAKSCARRTGAPTTRDEDMVAGEAGDARGRRGVAWGVAFAALAFLAVAGAMAAIMALPALGQAAGAVGAGTASGAGATAVTRADLWRDMLVQARDYAFTGSGLGATMMVDASYVRLLHVGFITHSHNLYLQIVLEQGPLGLLGFILIVGGSLAALVAAPVHRPLRLGAIASIVALLVHGIVDAGVYVALPAPLLFAATAAFGGLKIEDGRLKIAQGAAPIFNLRFSIFNRTLPPLALALILLAALLPPVRAAFLANLGAVAQSKAELSRYDWPTWGIQDELRRSGEVDLAPAISLYDGSLRLNPSDPVANRRLGQISLSLGDYAEAGALLSAAAGAGAAGAASDPAPSPPVSSIRPSAVRLYGEWLAIEGRTAEAAALWRTVDVSRGQLDARAWWYDHIGEPDRASFVRAAAARMN